MADLKLIVAGIGDHERALRTGEAKAQGIDLEVVDVDRPFMRMSRGLEFDVAEMSMSVYLCARSVERPFTAIPVFPNRGGFSAGISCRVDRGINDPRDLEGKRVGLRLFTVTNQVQGRGMLKSAFRVDTDAVTWVVFGESHVAEYVPPSNVEMAPAGKTLEGMLLDGEIDAALGVAPQSNQIRWLISPDESVEIDARRYRETGIWEIGQTVAIKDATLQAHPWIAEALFHAFTTAKNLYLQQLRAGKIETPEDRAWVRAITLVGDDPLPYGVAPNRKALDASVEMNLEQRVIPSRIDIDSLFVPSTRAFLG